MTQKRVYQVKIISAQTLKKLETLTNQWLELRAEFPEFEFITTQLNLSPLGSFKSVMIVYKGVLHG